MPLLPTTKTPSKNSLADLTVVVAIAAGFSHARKTNTYFNGATILLIVVGCQDEAIPA